MKKYLRKIADSIAKPVKLAAQTIVDEIDLSRSRKICVDDCRTVCLALGPYRNLTTLTAATLFLHPNCQVLNHAGDRIWGRKQIDFLSDYSPERLRRFVQFASQISTKGARGPTGGSITHSHAFDARYQMKNLSRDVGAELLKDRIECLFWKESLKTSNLIRSKRIDLGKIFAADGGRLRFLLPIRHPIDCAVSNIKTGLAKLFAGMPAHPTESKVLDAVLNEILWFCELQEQYPDRFFHFFQYDVSKEMLTKLAAFLRLDPTPEWIDAAYSAMQINDGYNHNEEILSFYQREVGDRFARFPTLQQGLLRFCA